MWQRSAIAAGSPLNVWQYLLSRACSYYHMHEWGQPQREELTQLRLFWLLRADSVSWLSLSVTLEVMSVSMAMPHTAAVTCCKIEGGDGAWVGKALALQICGWLRFHPLKYHRVPKTLPGVIFVQGTKVKPWAPSGIMLLFRIWNIWLISLPPSRYTSVCTGHIHSGLCWILVEQAPFSFADLTQLKGFTDSQG